MIYPFLAVIAAILLQGVTHSPEDLLRLQRPLTSAEMDTVVSGIRQALAGMTLRLIGDRHGRPEILLGRDGMPRMIRTASAASGERVATVTRDGIGGDVPIPSTPERVILLTEYTAIPARRCNGTPATGHMVVEYLLSTTSGVWSVTARERRRGDVAFFRPLAMLSTAASLKSGEIKLVGNRTARAIVSPWTQSDSTGVFITGDPPPNAAEFVPMQSLWIDTSSLLPLRWEISQRQAIVDGVDFVYEPLEFQRPSTVDAPNCIH